MSGLAVWFAGDIANTLRAIDAAHTATACRMATNAQDAAYREGYADALRAVALAFGIVGAGSEPPRLTIDAAYRGRQ
ncbi:MAG: hypothetical protein HZB53_20020 [Chloroflexi bacterium]|nr:hypothetical protein [Chloroflexota bacterium]